MADTDEERRIQAILASGIKIPPMPAVLMGLEKVLRDEDAGPAELADLIAHDGALSGAVFRVVSSPVFGLRSKVETLPRAVALLGMRNTAALIRSETLRATLSDPEHAKAFELLWKRSAAVAELCVIAVKKARRNGIGPDNAYMLGMFHDCGLALLCKRFPAYAQSLGQAWSWPDILELDRHNQLSHAMMGQMVAKNWSLPEDIVHAIRHHHDLSPPGLSEPVGRLCALLNFACHLHNQSIGADDREWMDAWHEETRRRLGMDEAEIADWEAAVLEEAAP